MGNSTLTLISITISIVAAFISARTLFYFLKERKSSLRTVVYERQIEASLELLSISHKLIFELNDWNNQKQNKKLSGIDYEKKAETTYREFTIHLLKYSPILPELIFDNISDYIPIFERQMEESKVGHYVNTIKENLVFYMKLHNKIRFYFGIEKLSDSAINVIEHFNEVNGKV